MTGIALLATITCCDRRCEISPPDTQIPAASQGCELGRATCDLCGTTYVLGMIVQPVIQVETPAPEGVPEEVFEHLSDEDEERAGIDRTDFSEPPDEVMMCARCDGTAVAGDMCRGCGDYVHRSAECRTREPRNPRRHATEEHWEEPRFESVKTAAVSMEDDGSRLTGDDVFEAEE